MQSSIARWPCAPNSRSQSLLMRSGLSRPQAFKRTSDNIKSNILICLRGGQSGVTCQVHKFQSAADSPFGRSSHPVGGSALELIQQMLKAGYEDKGRRYETPRGTPQGGVYHAGTSMDESVSELREIRREGISETRLTSLNSLRRRLVVFNGLRASRARRPQGQYHPSVGSEWFHFVPSNPWVAVNWRKPAGELPLCAPNGKQCDPLEQDEALATHEVDGGCP
jgi:hypothetical protein